MCHVSIRSVLISSSLSLHWQLLALLTSFAHPYLPFKVWRAQHQPVDCRPFPVSSSTPAAIFEQPNHPANASAQPPRSTQPRTVRTPPTACENPDHLWPRRPSPRSPATSLTRRRQAPILRCGSLLRLDMCSIYGLKMPIWLMLQYVFVCKTTILLLSNEYPVSYKISEIIVSLSIANNKYSSHSVNDYHYFYNC